MNRHLSPSTVELIIQLQRKSIWRRLVRSDPSVELVQRIAAQDEPAAAHYLLPLIFSPNRDIAAASAQAIHHLVGIVLPGELLWLDEHFRNWYPEHVPAVTEWFDITPDSLSQLAAFDARSVSLLGLASFHGNGFVRQRAIELLSDYRTGAELPFLLLRLNDWVANVRRAAQVAVHSRIGADYARHFIRSINLVTRLERASRAEHGTVIDAVLAMLQQPQNRAALTELVRASDRHHRRLGYRLLLESEPRPYDLLSKTLGDVDPTIRFWAVHRAVAVLQGESLSDFLIRALADPMPGVRSSALSALHVHAPQKAAEHAAEALLDSSAVLRQQARLLSRLAGVNDAAGVYRQVLEGDQRTGIRRAAILGLGETGTVEDVIRLQPFASHHLPQLRQAALWALDRLTGADNITDFLTALHDPSARVSRQAACNLMAYVSRIEPERLRRNFRDAAQPHTKLNLLRLMANLRKWESLALLLEALDDPASDVRQRASAHIRDWLAGFNRTFIVPQVDERARLRALLDSRRFLLRPDLYRELEFTIRE